MKAKDIVLTVNGAAVRRPPESGDLMLIDFLQEDLGLTGTKLGCGIGVCRACTVAVRDKAGAALKNVQSCVTPVSAVDGKQVTTVEYLASDGRLHPLQQAFLDEFAFQCGYSTPGFLMAAWVLLDQLRRVPVARDRVDDTIMGAVGNNVCRCTGYVRYIRAIRKVVLATPGLVVPSR